jgi:branched-chain amino acid transport system ATP-binding protein
VTSILNTDNLVKAFDGLRAVDGVSTSVEEGSVTGLIGPNGSGKTTLFNVIAGFFKPTSGRVFFKGKRIDGLRPYEIFRQGLVRSYQNPRLFTGMTLLENVLIPPRDQLGERFRNAPLQWTWSKQEIEHAGKALESLSLVALQELYGNLATDISGGQMKLMELARATMGEPTLMLLDEPTAGVAPKLATEIFERIDGLRDKLRLTFFIIEHRLDLLFNYVDRVLVMHRGQIIADGKPDEVAKDAQVIDVYLG